MTHFSLPRHRHEANLKPSATVILKLALSAGLIVAIVALVDVRALLRVVAGADPWRLTFAAVLLAAGHLGTALRFGACLRPLRVRLPIRRIIDVTFLAVLLNQVLPTGLSGDVVRIFAIGRKTSIARVTYASLADRAFGLGVILLNCLIAVPLYTGGHRGEITLTVYGTGIAMGLGLAFVLLARRRWLATLRRRWRLVPGVVWNALKAARIILHWRHLMAVGGAMLFAYVPYLLGFYVIGTALGPMPVATLGGIPLVFLLMQIPLSVGGWGIREGAALIILTTLGASAEVALGAALSYGILMIASSAPIVMFEQWRRGSA